MPGSPQVGMATLLEHHHGVFKGVCEPCRRWGPRYKIAIKSTDLCFLLLTPIALQAYKHHWRQHQ